MLNSPSTVHPKIPWYILALLLLLNVGMAADFKLMAELARSRYGQDAGIAVTDWESMIQQISHLPESEKLTRVNTYFNERVRFGADIDIWKESDYWATPLETLSRNLGDCEDFSIAKYVTLQYVGVPVEKLRLTYVKARIGGRLSNVTQAHMVLSYYNSPGAEPKILDNLIPDIRPASRRKDLTPVFGFNSAGLWVGGAPTPAANNPAAKLSRWRDLLVRMKEEGL